jgi:pyruvate,water dikinase
VKAYVIPFEQLTMRDLETVGGKNASLGEMIGALARLGVQVPGGFATTAHAYREFLEQGGLQARIRAELAKLDVDDVARLAATGARIRQWILATPFPPALTAAVSAQLERMSAGADVAVAVRSSATAEDLPEASFAGQQESFLNVRGEAAVLKAMHEVFASLFNDRAISYRVHQGFDHAAVALSAGVQHMVRSDLSASGVMFTLDPDSGFRDVVFITAAWGLGETVVQGAVNPDEFYVYKPALRAGKLAILRRNLGGKAVKMVYAPAGSPERVQTVAVPPAERQRFCLSDADILTLARQALIIEEHYERPMTSSGRATAPRARSSSCRRGLRRCRAAPAAAFNATLSRAARGCWPPAAASASASAPEPRASSATRAKWHACRTATCWSPT